MNIGVFDYIVIALYLVLMICIALFFAKRKIENFDDYFLAGGKLPVAVLIATFTSSYFGVDSLTGNSEMGFSMGMSGFFSYCFIAWIMMIVLAFVGFKIKGKLGDAKTTIEIISGSYGTMSRISTAIGSLCYTIPVVNIMGMGIAFSVVLGIDFWLGVVISAIISTAYTYFGGLAAVSVTDTINFFIIAVGVGITGFIGWKTLGVENVWNGLETMAGGDPSYFFTPSGGWMSFGLMLTYSLTAISVLCEPTLFQRIFAAKDAAAVRKALLIGSFIYLSYALISTILGTLAASGVGLGVMGDISASESLASFAVHFLPVGLVGLFLAGFLAAGLSTCDSMLLIAGSNISYDLYQSFSKKERTEKQKLQTTKNGVLIASAISLILCFAFGRVMSAWVFVSSMLVNTTLVPFYTALFMKGKKSKLAGDISSGIGLFGTLFCYFGTWIFGYYDEAWATRMFDITLFGHTFTFWQEHTILLVLPVVIISYFVVHLITNPNKKEA